MSARLSLQLALLLILLPTCLLDGKVSAAEQSVVLKRYNFAGDASTQPQDWLEGQLFQVKHHFRDPDRIALSQFDEALHLQVKEEAFGIMLHEEDIPGARRVRLHWGVSQYPDGATYQHGVDDEAIMVYVFFGHETYDSGSWLIPDSPYFIGFYLCKDGTDKLEMPYAGHHFQKSGRYICVDHPPIGETVVTEIDLLAEFRKSFGLEVVPPVSGISIEVDTTHADNDGRAAAFISRLEFLE